MPQQIKPPSFDQSLAGIAHDFTHLFPMPWADVPRLLQRLAGEKGLVIERFAAEPDGTPDRCRITLEFAPPAQGFGVR